PADPARRAPAYRGCTLPVGSLPGQAVRQRDRRAGVLPRRADPRWLRLSGGLSGGTAVPRCAHHPDLRRHQRNPAPADCPGAEELPAVNAYRATATVARSIGPILSAAAG